LQYFPKNFCSADAVKSEYGDFFCMDDAYEGVPLTNDNFEMIGILVLSVVRTDTKIAALQTEKELEIKSKQVEFYHRAIDLLILNLERLAEGNLSIDPFQGETEKDTQRIGEKFTIIDTVQNMRRYLKVKSLSALANLSSTVILRIAVKPEDMYDEYRSTGFKKACV
jgi:hypothetical protein